MSYGLGIDVGTTYSAAAIMRDGAMEAFSLGTYQVAVPSVIYAAGDEMLFGTDAARRGVVDPTGLAREFKRRLGDPVPVVLSGAPYHADRLTALMARWVFDTVVEQTGGAPDEVVLTHPANWTQYQLRLLEQALDGVDLGGVGLVSEPAAAALDYASASTVDEGALLLVYDLGGGTFDVALLRRVAGGFEQAIEPAGIERLGGIDFDEAVFQFVLQHVPEPVLDATRADAQGGAALANMRRMCVEAKESLSSSKATDIPVMLPNHSTSVRITRPEFEAMVRPMIRQTIDLVARIVHRAGIPPSDLSAVLLVGGSSRIPFVTQLVSELLQLPVRVDAHPKLVVAKGAARRAAEGGATGSRRTVRTSPRDHEPPPVQTVVTSPVVTRAEPIAPVAGGAQDDVRSEPAAPASATPEPPTVVEQPPPDRTEGGPGRSVTRVPAAGFPTAPSRAAAGLGVVAGLLWLSTVIVDRHDEYNFAFDNSGAAVVTVSLGGLALVAGIIALVTTVWSRPVSAMSLGTIAGLAPLSIVLLGRGREYELDVWVGAAAVVVAAIVLLVSAVRHRLIPTVPSHPVPVALALVGSVAIAVGWRSTWARYEEPFEEEAGLVDMWSSIPQPGSSWVTVASVAVVAVVVLGALCAVQRFAGGICIGVAFPVLPVGLFVVSKFFADHSTVWSNVEGELHAGLYAMLAGAVALLLAALAWSVLDRRRPS